MSQLTKTKVNPIRQLVYLSFDDNSYFPVSLDDYYRLHPTDISPSLVEVSLLFLLKTYALRQLAFSPKSAVILKFKLRRHYYQLLRRYQYPLKPPFEPLLDSIIDYLNSHSLLNSASFIEHLINKNSLKSARHLTFLFQQAGLTPAEYSSYLPDLRRGDEAKIRQLIAKKSAISPPKLISWLINHGFREDSVKTIIDETDHSR